MTNPIKKFKILQDYRTLKSFIPKGNIGIYHFNKTHVSFSTTGVSVVPYNEVVDFSLSEIISNTDWFQEIPLDYKEPQEFKVGDSIKINYRECLITCKYNFQDDIVYSLGSGETLTEKELIKLCSKPQ